jgi:hypothetical protein
MNTTSMYRLKEGKNNKNRYKFRQFSLAEKKIKKNYFTSVVRGKKKKRFCSWRFNLRI